jgi:hypothetical protein
MRPNEADFGEDQSDGLFACEAMRETDREVAARLAALEALDPSQERPTPKHNGCNHGDFLSWETYHDLGVQPFRQQKAVGFVRRNGD